MNLHGARMHDDQWDSLIALASHSDNTDVAIIGWMESRYHYNIRSSAGAIGVMQVMPRTARGIAIECGVSDIHYSSPLPTVARQLTNPDINVRIGICYWEMMLQLTGDRISKALIAYNAGLTRRNNNVALLPRETINYVTQFHVYREELGQCRD
jgi:soluble lytic murein transglycosylase-like protein